MLRVFLPTIDTVLLDVDGTLVDGNDARAAASRATAGYDIQAAHAAGMPAISLRCGGASEADLTDSAATLRDIVASTNAARKVNA